MLRYSLGTLLLAVIYFAVGSAALVHANGVWPHVILTLTLGLLILSTLAAICWRDRPRRFAMGFAVSGWIYFLIVFGSFVNARGFLLTEVSVNWLYTTIHANQTVAQVPFSTTAVIAPAGYAAPVPTVVPPGPMPYQTRPPSAVPATYTYVALAPQGATSWHFNAIGHSLWTAILAAVGGCIAQLLAIRKAPATHSHASISA